MKTIRPFSQGGLSLVELLIALTISCFLILGITQIYIDNKRSYAYRQNQAVNQEGARFAELLLNQYLGKAGYRRAPDQLLEAAFPERNETDDCRKFAEGIPVTAAKDATGICIRYQPLVSGEPDCQGDDSKGFDDSRALTPSTDALIILALKYLPADAVKNEEISNGRLVCKSLNAVKPATVELLSGIADFQMEFGLGKNDLLDRKIERFKGAADWTAADGPIRAVRYSILLASQKNQRDGDSIIYGQWLARADSSSKALLQKDDNRRIYQVASSTQTLRNLLP